MVHYLTYMSKQKNYDRFLSRAARSLEKMERW